MRSPIAALKDWLAHPLTRGMDIDDPRTTELRRRIVRQKPFLKAIYDEWYGRLAGSVSAGAGGVLEIGSGGGFLRDLIPELITSDVFACEGVDRVLDAHDLPFAAGELRAILMTDVLHHLREPRRFFASAARSVRPGGSIAMIEPWVSTWSRVIYTRLHHEPFRPNATEWEFPASGPLSGANGALPWILFSRDRAQFETEFPQWRIERIERMMPFRYLVSGGVSMRSLTPGWSYPLWKGFEAALAPAGGALAMFAHIVVRRTDVPAGAAPTQPRSLNAEHVDRASANDGQHSIREAAR